MTRWEEIEAAGLLAAAFAIQNRESTVSKACRRFYRRNPRTATAIFIALCVWFAVHVRREPRA